VCHSWFLGDHSRITSSTDRISSTIFQDETGALIYLPKESIPGTSVREVTISGTPEAVGKCQYLLQVSCSA
jgi:hypothetical protein